MTLREKAIEKFLTFENMKTQDAIYSAGWENGEWTCCCCGTMIGKNLKGESPFSLARSHAGRCAWEGNDIPLYPKPKKFEIVGDVKGW